MKTKKEFKKQKGITLIALVITIIVLLILAGVTIATLTGDNGILTRTNQAKTKMEEATLEEKIRLLATETMINQYTGKNEEKTAQDLQDELNEQGENVLVIQWDKYIIFDLEKNKEYRVMNDGTTEYWGESIIGKILLNTKKANSEQISQDPSTSNIIGIDDEGNTVNMLLWEYTLIDDNNLGKIGTYGLNDRNGLDINDASGRSKGYIGKYTEDGKISGTVPAYISKDGGSTYTTVTSIVRTFYACDDLITAPQIPDTVTLMRETFRESKNLITGPKIIPNSVMNMGATFNNCTSLINGPTTLSDNLVNMGATFYNCSSMVTGPTTIPNSVINLQATFYECASLTTAPSIISSSVTNMFQTFRGCSRLTGKIEINANLGEDIVYEFDGYKYKGYNQTFTNSATEGDGLIILKNSTCPKLQELVSTKSQNSNIKIEE